MKEARFDTPCWGACASSAPHPASLPGPGPPSFQVFVMVFEPAPVKPTDCGAEFMPSLRSNRYVTLAGPVTVIVDVKVSVAGHRPCGLAPETEVAREETRGAVPAFGTIPGVGTGTPPPPPPAPAAAAAPPPPPPLEPAAAAAATLAPPAPEEMTTLTVSPGATRVLAGGSVCATFPEGKSVLGCWVRHQFQALYLG